MELEMEHHQCMHRTSQLKNLFNNKAKHQNNKTIIRVYLHVIILILQLFTNYNNFELIKKNYLSSCFGAE